MKVLKANKYRLRVRSKHMVLLARFAGCQRWVWNHFLALQKQRLDSGLRCLSYPDMCKELASLKKEEKSAFLSEAPSQTLQQTLKDLDRALKDSFSKKVAFPNFKKRGASDSFRYPQGFRTEDAKIYLPKLGWMKFYSSSFLPSQLSNATVSRRGKHWYVSVQYELEVKPPRHPSRSRVGIDMGIKRFATLSTGEYLLPLNSFKKLERKLAREQRALSRKVKGSSNWQKQKYRVQNIHIKIADARRDYLHKASTSISKNHAIVVLEDLKVCQMSHRNPKEENGVAKRNLNRRILDQGWYEFRRQLEYKQQWRGGSVLLVNPRNTSRTCPKCGHISPDNRKSQSVFRCQRCEFSGNADLIAACNILMAVGHTVSACGVISPVAV